MDMSNNNGPYKEIIVTHFGEFESEYHKLNKRRHHKSAVFRGQSDSDWGLVATLFRDSIGVTELDDEYFTRKMSEEFLKIRFFVQIADKMGIDLPGDLQKLINNRDNINNFRNTKLYSQWHEVLNNPYTELITIAQHHGMPTRFLDFSFSANVSLFFAALGAFNKLSTSENKDKLLKKSFSLWMIDRNYLYNNKCSIGHFETPTARNIYLNAQRGLFLYPDLPYFGFGLTSKSLNLKEVAIKNCYDIEYKEQDFKMGWPFIIKFNFSYDLSAVVLNELDERFDVNISSIMPNLDNIIIYHKFRENLEKYFDHVFDTDAGW